MSNIPKFAISPAKTSSPQPVVLHMPPAGYRAVASIADPCGHPVHGAYVTVSGNVATPHGLPNGTSYVQWRITAADPSTSASARISLTLASQQTVGGKQTTCTTGPSPYGHPGATAPRAGLAVSPPAHSGLPAIAIAAPLAAALLLTLCAAIVWRRLGRHTGSRAAR